MNTMEIESKFGLRGYELLIFKAILDATESDGCYDKGEKAIARKVSCTVFEVKEYLQLLINKGLVKKDIINLYNNKYLITYRACADIDKKAKAEEAYFESLFKE